MSYIHQHASLLNFTGVTDNDITQYRINSPPKALQLASKLHTEAQVSFCLTLNISPQLSSPFHTIPEGVPVASLSFRYGLPFMVR